MKLPGQLCPFHETSAYHVLVRITVKPESAAQAAAILIELVAQSRQEPGCVSYELYQQSATPHVFQTVERWQDAAALFAAQPEILAYQQLA